jgi:magnesium chelatase subunit D
MARSADAALACALLALSPMEFGGAVLRGPGGPTRDGWISSFRALAPDRPVFRLPPHTGTDRLLGSLDVAATLKSGIPRHDKGLLAEADGGVLLLTSAERLDADKAGFIAAAMDTGSVQGPAGPVPARVALIVCDEGVDADERAPDTLSERVAFVLDLGDCDAPALNGLELASAARLLPSVNIPDTVAEGLCQTAMALGIASLRPALFALRAARACAALDLRATVTDSDAMVAARLVLAPRARQFPAPDTDEAQQAQADQPPPGEPDDSTQESAEAKAMSDVLLDAVRAALPPGLLAELERNLLIGRQARAGSGATAAQTGPKRGRPAGSRSGQPRNGSRLNLIETLRAAAPWQPLRRSRRPGSTAVIVEKDDFRIRRFKQNRQTTAIFVVDASGSAALHRMAEAKGAVELLLADCYVRRDSTALIAFRGKTADVLLPPTRSLQRAKRSLAELPGGGGTPLAAGIESALTVAAQVRRGGGTPLVVFLTDGRANIARDGTADRQAAMRDAEAAAQALRLAQVRTLMIDLSDNRQGAAARIAEKMGAAYLPLPHANSGQISRTVGAALKAGR